MMIYAVLAAILVVCSVISFALYARDKSKAQKNAWRIKESTLIASAFLMGGIGAALGMKILRHKTQHTLFKVMVPLGIVVNIAVVVAVLYFADALPF